MGINDGEKIWKRQLRRAEIILHGCASLHAATAKPPVRMEFPKFGVSRGSTDVTDFIEQCENFLSLRPLSDTKLLGTLNTVLKGPARSWWLAARSKIAN